MRQVLTLNQEANHYCALFVVPTPVADDSGVAHVAEHLVFRGSDSFPAAHNLFAALTLLPVDINASTQNGTTFYYVISPQKDVFERAVMFVYAGLLQQQYTDEAIAREKDGVIYQELEFRERTGVSDDPSGGFTSTVSGLTAQVVRNYKLQHYQPDTITLVTYANVADTLCHMLKLPQEIITSLHPASSAAPKQSPFPALIKPLQFAWLNAQKTLNAAFANIPPSTNCCQPITDRMFILDGLEHLVSLGNAMSLPRYVREQLLPLLMADFVATPQNDWLCRLPLDTNNTFAMLQCIQSEAFWTPRTNGNCYAQGVAVSGEALFIYGVNDRQAVQRQQFIQQIASQFRLL